MRFISAYFPVLLACTSFAMYSFPVFSEPLNQAINTENSIHSAAIKSQAKINGLDEHTRSMLARYRSDARQTKTLKTYNAHLQTLITSQNAEKLSFNQQLEQIDITQREIVPLILNMQKSLAEFVALDIPFLPKERQKRIESLNNMMVRADVTNAEKFRRIIEAYQIENNYGNTIEAYRGDISLQGEISSVDFLRLGRVALYYQRLDGSETGIWDVKKQAWRVLSNAHRNAIRRGLRVARKETAPNLLSLPLHSPVEAR